MTVCSWCGQAYETGEWPWCPHGFPSWSQRTQWHERDAVVVWEDAQGNVQYPDRNDRVIPERLRARGFERKEMRSLRTVEAFERSHNVRNEAMWYDRNGRGFDSQ